MFIGDTYISEAVQTHARLFLSAMLWGAAVALTYDVIRVMRRVWKPPKWLYICEDMLFWIIEALFIYRLLFIYDSGAIRSYTMFGMIAGMALYLWIFGKWLATRTAGLINRLLGLVKKLLSCVRKFLRVLLRPFLRLTGALFQLVRGQIKRCRKSGSG